MFSFSFVNLCTILPKNVRFFFVFVFFYAVFNSVQVSFLFFCFFPFFCRPFLFSFFIINCSFTAFLNLISASLYLYLIIITGQYFNKIPNPLIEEFKKYPEPQIFSTPLWGRPSQNLVWLLPVPKISIPFQGNFTEHFQFPQLFQISKSSHSLNYRSKGIWAFSRQYHRYPEILPDLGLKS